MQMVLLILTVQALIGALDNLWHHEIKERLPDRRSARSELALHSIREFIYSLIFTALGWYRCHGLWGLLLALLFLTEIAVTVSDFVIEDRTRKLPGFERVLHTLLAINFGILIAVSFPILFDWITLPTQLVREDYGVLSRLMTVFSVGVLLWAIRNLLAVIRLGRAPVWRRQPIARRDKANPRHILVAGATGFIGCSLVRKFIEIGDHVTVISRLPDKAVDLFGPQVTIVSRANEIEPGCQVDAVINLAGAPILGGLWTRRRKRELIDSRISVIKSLEQLVAGLTHKPAVFITASAIGYYGVRGDEPLTENAPGQDIFQSRLCRDVERAAENIEKYGVRVCCLRIGVVLGSGGGFFQAMLRPVRLCLGAVTGHGRQWISWIYLPDLVRVFLFTLSQGYLTGPINAVAPEPVRQKNFIKALADKVNRPLFITIPGVLLKLILGELSQLLVEGQRVVPKKLMDAGFGFNKPRLDTALADLLEETRVGYQRRDPGGIEYDSRHKPRRKINKRMV